MSKQKHIDLVCVLAVLAAIGIMVLLFMGEALGLEKAETVLGYENRIFSTDTVHTIDIVMEDWEGFLETCENEEYAACSVVIDGEAYKNIGIRAKGNTSLSMVSSLGSDRYSFKLEFDQYEAGNSYYGLDKLSLNNLIQDSTMMKDYLTYQMMGSFGAAAPLCSYAYLTVNGEDWGLYLAVEAIEESFLLRNYGSGYGDLYKPDSTAMGGGPGNGRNFDMNRFMEGDTETAMDQQADAKLQYVGDDTSQYSVLWDSAKTDVTEADKARLVAALKALSEGENLEDALDIDALLRYFTVHNFVVNGDSYTGSMVHNYYLYEEDGKLSMIPWDYNLAFGTFQGNRASDAVNDSLDSPLNVGKGDRPVVDWIFADPQYTAQYHAYMAEFLETTDFSALVEDTAALIAPYVEKDPTKFYTTEEFQNGTETLKEFCLLRQQSLLAQLEDADADAVDASHLTLSDMGSMNMDGGNGGGGNRGGQGGRMPTQTSSERVPTAAEGMERSRQEAPGEMPGRDRQGDLQTQGERPSEFPQQGQSEETASEQRPQGDRQQGGRGMGGMNGQLPQTFEGQQPEMQMSADAPSEERQAPEEQQTSDDQQAPEEQRPVEQTQDESGSQRDRGSGGMRSQGGFGQNREMQGSQSSGTQNYLLLGISVLVLAAGLAFAILWKRW